MLHELLLALSGHPGSIFVKDNHSKSIQVLSNVPFLCETEVSLLNRICLLASQYGHLQDFIRLYGKTPFQGSTEDLHGLYVRALCEGLDRVLAPYRAALLSIEKELLQDEHLTPAYVQTELEEYHLLFPALVVVVEQVKQHKAHGCHILDMLHRASANGMTIVQQAFIQLLHLCHSILYRQLSSWMLHGILHDTYQEFFIQRRTLVPTAQQASTPDEVELGLTGTMSKQIRDLVALTEGVSHENTQYCLESEMLPSYIPTRVAQKILFVGESVAMFDRNRKGPFSHSESILKTRSSEFAKKLLFLSQQKEFCLMNFEACIDEIRTYAAEQLWVLVVEKSDLIGELRCLKDFFLLGRGELFLAFIDLANGLLSGLPSASTQHDVNVNFHMAARTVFLEDEKLLQKFTLELPNVHEQVKRRTDSLKHRKKYVVNDSSSSKDSGSSSSQVSSGWSDLCLAYSVDWPLHILFTQSVLERYNQVWCFLLFVRRTQLTLQQCWATQMAGKHNMQSFSNKWWLRTHMGFLVDNLQYYLQVDVIDSQFSVLEEKINKTHDFEAICLAHDHFLNALLSQSFLLMKPIALCLRALLDLCNRYCSLLNCAEESLNEDQSQQMEAISKEFHQRTQLLFQLLSNVRNHQVSPHLAQFLLRLDYNKFFSSSGHLSS